MHFHGFIPFLEKRALPQSGQLPEYEGSLITRVYCFLMRLPFARVEM